MNLYKEALLMHVTCGIDYRKSKALKHPDDTRNLACSTALEGAAETVLALPDDHLLFKQLAAVNLYDCECWNEQERSFISEWGFFNREMEAYSGVGFVDELSELIESYLTEQALNKLAEEFYKKLIGLLDMGWFREELDCRFEYHLGEDFKDELAEEFLGELAETLSEKLTEEYAEKPVDDIDRIVSDCLNQHAEVIEAQGEAFIQSVPHRIWA